MNNFDESRTPGGAERSDRLEARLGGLARTDRIDPNGTLDEREPDELFAPLDDPEEPGNEPRADPPGVLPDHGNAAG